MKPLSRIILSVLIASFICHLGYLFIRKQLGRYQYHMEHKLTELFLNDTSYDILFLGSSKTHANIHPGVVDTVCGVSSYNAGIDGISLFEYNMILTGYLQHHAPPDMVVMSVDLHSFNGQRKFFNQSQYLPFIDNKVVDTTFSSVGYPTWTVKTLPFLNLMVYADDDKLVNVIKGLIGKTVVPSGDYVYKGYLSNSDMVMSERTVDSQSQYMDASGIELFDNIYRTCLQNNIQLLVLYSPEYRSGIINLTKNSGRVLDSITLLCDQRNIPFLRHDRLEMCDDSVFFRNTGHLNKKGARLYSAILAKQINELKNGKDTAVR